MAARIKGVFEKMPGSGIWWIRFADSDGRIRREKAGTKAQAKQLYFKRKAEALQRKKLPELLRAKPTDFAELAKDCLEYSLANKRSYRVDKSRMKLLVESFGRSARDGAVAMRY